MWKERREDGRRISQGQELQALSNRLHPLPPPLSPPPSHPNVVSGYVERVVVSLVSVFVRYDEGEE
jgi:hypothetical protein